MADAIENIDNAGSAPVESGDFGEGVATLEEQLLASIPKEGEEVADGTETPTPPEAAPIAVEKTAAPVVPAAPVEQTKLFDINGKISLKAGETLSSEHIKELERGWLREADYTRKTQEVSKIRNEAQVIIDNQAKITADPRAMFEFMTPEKVLSAFTRQEMLSHGLHAGGVTPQAWNQFIEWRKANGEESDKEPTPSADPQAQERADYHRRLEKMERRDAEREETAKSAEQKAAYDRQMSDYDKEVDSAIAEFPSVPKRALLVEMASSDGSKTIRKIAAEMSTALESRFQEYLETKKTQKQTTVKAPKGQAVPVVKKLPKTFDEVEAHVASLMGVDPG